MSDGNLRMYFNDGKSSLRSKNPLPDPFATLKSKSCHNMCSAPKNSLDGIRPKDF
jgi:hypothetical protein